jgi:hypothetical protein
MLVAVRRPGNPLGWLLPGCGVLFSTETAAVAYRSSTTGSITAPCPSAGSRSLSSPPGRPVWS